MNIRSYIYSLIGQMKGHGRLDIRRRAAVMSDLDPSDLRGIQEMEFCARAFRAVNDCPQYRDKVMRHQGRDPLKGWVPVPEEMPIWTKEDQRSLFAMQEDNPPEKAFVNSTGGSSGIPLQYYTTRESWEWRTAVSDRGYSWAGAELGRRSVYIWGTPIYKQGQSQLLKTRLNSFLQNRWFFDSFNFPDEKKEECCHLINRVKPSSLVGYASNLAELAVFVRDNPGILKWKAASAVTAAESIYPWQRAFIREYLAEDVFASYGSREFMLIGMECKEHCGYHVSDDNLMIEVVDDNGLHVKPGESGRILVTDLHNYATPFIRYEIGDIGTAGIVEDDFCLCGQPFSILQSVEGRDQERVQLPSGESVTALFIPHLMKEFKWIDAYQILQPDNSQITVTVITKDEPDQKACESVERVLRTKLGADLLIGFKRVTALQKNKSGKTPIVIKPTN